MAKHQPSGNFLPDLGKILSSFSSDGHAHGDLENDPQVVWAVKQTQHFRACDKTDTGTFPFRSGREWEMEKPGRARVRGLLGRPIWGSGPRQRSIILREVGNLWLLSTHSAWPARTSNKYRAGKLGQIPPARSECSIRKMFWADWRIICNCLGSR